MRASDPQFKVALNFFGSSRQVNAKLVGLEVKSGGQGQRSSANGTPAPLNENNSI